MPKIVDHVQRKKDIGDIVLRVIKAHGIQKVTIRSISREGGFSSGVLSHYFTCKQEMLDFAFGIVAQQTIDRVSNKLQVIDDPWDKLTLVVVELLPVEHDDLEFQLPVHLWAVAMTDESLSAHLRDVYAVWRALLKELLHTCATKGYLKKEVNVSIEVDLIFAQADGLLASWAIDPTYFTREYKLKLIENFQLGLKAKLCAR